ncbi:MAG: HEAT repeat domain-containing protein [Spirochaetia bacterium]|nr:HEAT repeat domain-containing protein [Spirochaetia bacterium]
MALLIKKYAIGFCLAILFAGCASKQIKTSVNISADEFSHLSWDNKINVFERGENYIVPYEIYELAFRESEAVVVIAALDSIPEKSSEDYKSILYPLLRYSNPVVRWKSCQKISASPRIEDLPFLILNLRDRDWMVKECTVKSIRQYREEKNNKDYFFNIVALLFEANTQVLREVYKTLKWYDDARAFPFMYKRSFHVDNTSVLIVILQELVEYNNDEVRQRLWHLSRNSPSYFVREEAKKLLATM